MKLIPMPPRKLSGRLKRKNIIAKCYESLKKTNSKRIKNCKQMRLIHLDILLINNMLKFIKAQVKKL